jgi:hypothetical protein
MNTGDRIYNLVGSRSSQSEQPHLFGEILVRQITLIPQIIRFGEPRLRGDALGSLVRIRGPQKRRFCLANSVSHGGPAQQGFDLRSASVKLGNGILQHLVEDCPRKRSLVDVLP